MLSAFLLFSCQKSSPAIPALAPEEVLRRAAQTSRELHSMNYRGETSFTVTGGDLPITGTAGFKGALDQDSDALQSTLTIDAQTTAFVPPGQKLTIKGAGDVVMIGKRDTYFRLQSLSTDSDQVRFQKDLLDRMLGVWWHVPSTEPDVPIVAGGTFTPSPSLLRAQSQVVKVIADKGATVIDGRNAYHLQVGIDQARLLQFLEDAAKAKGTAFDRTSASASLRNLKATGEMWVDAQTFSLLRVSWNIDSLTEGNNAAVFGGTFTISFSDFNTVPAITPPSDAKPLSPEFFSPSPRALPSSDIPFVPVGSSLPSSSSAIPSGTTPAVLPSSSLFAP